VRPHSSGGLAIYKGAVCMDPWVVSESTGLSGGGPMSGLTAGHGGKFSGRSVRCWGLVSGVAAS
jgi:hypothetical protein